MVHDQVELLGQLLRVMDVRIQTGSEGQRKLTLGNATILAYCLRWPEFRVRRAPPSVACRGSRRIASISKVPTPSHSPMHGRACRVAAVSGWPWKLLHAWRAQRYLFPAI